MRHELCERVHDEFKYKFLMRLSWHLAAKHMHLHFYP